MDSLLPVSEDWHESPEPWIDIFKGNLAERIEDAFRRTHEVLTTCCVG
jgi:hypothetical protein